MRSPTDTPFFRGVAQTELAIRNYRGKAPMFFAKARMLGAIFTVNSKRAAALLPEKELRPITVLPGRALAAVFAFDYAFTDLGPYKEVFISIPIVPKRQLKPVLAAHTVQLPVDSEAALFGGIDLYNVPKYIAKIRCEQTGTLQRCTVTDAEEGRVVFELEGRMPTPKNTHRLSPFKRLRLRNYAIRDGERIAATIDFHFPRAGFRGLGCDARILVGDSRRSRMLRDLEFGSALCAFTGEGAEAILHEPRRG